jgi:hypothetical protein
LRGGAGGDGPGRRMPVLALLTSSTKKAVVLGRSTILGLGVS